jgi:acetylornithine deacetylase/succinyl-diaminopimelate desuccinylase-like protein
LIYKLLMKASLFLLCLFLALFAIDVAFAEPEVEKRYLDNVAWIKSHRRVQQALSHIESLEQDNLDLLIEITEVEAPPFKEERRGAFFAHLLRETGLTDVRVDEVGNVIGVRPGVTGDRVVVYSAHLDTVFPEGTNVDVRVEGDRLHAPGIGDNSQGLINALSVLRAMQYAELETDADVWFIGNVGEEGLGDLRGVKHLFRDGAPEKIDSMIAIDGGNSESIVFGGVGSHRYRVTFKGQGGHSWGAFGMANPHHALARMIATFDRNAPQVTNFGDRTSYNIGRIGGGTSVNSIPYESWAEVDMRSGSQEKLDQIDRVFQAAVDIALDAENLGRTVGPPLKVEVEMVGKRPAAKGDPNMPLVQRSVAATRAFGIEPRLQISSTDANLPLSLGIPAITISRGGRGGNAHSPNEWWENKDAHIGIQIGLITLLAEAGLVTPLSRERTVAD